MRKAFVVAPTGAKLDLEYDPDIKKIAKMIVTRTVVVQTPECIGEAVVVADCIITSLFLVRNHRMVKIQAPFCGQTVAVVSSRDERNYLAKLQPIELVAGRSKICDVGKMQIRKGDSIGGHGDALFTSNAKNGVANVSLSAMSYSIQLSASKEIEENAWHIDRQLPTGVVGGGVWNLEGEFIGLSLGRKVPQNAISPLLLRECLLALPAGTVMDFAETK
jgi:hypothetical protein